MSNRRNALGRGLGALIPGAGNSETKPPPPAVEPKPTVSDPSATATTATETRPRSSGPTLLRVGDIDPNDAVDFQDLVALLSNWGGSRGPSDLDGSGTVDFGDLLVVLGAWGPCS